MSGIAVLLLFLIAAGADSIAEQYGFITLYTAVAVCCGVIMCGEVRNM